MDENKWDKVKEKIKDIEKDPYMGQDTMKTLDTMSIADYWRRRFEEEHNLSAKLLTGKDQEISQLESRVERHSTDLQLLRQQLESAHVQLVDKQRFWEERHRGLEMENRGMREKMDWEIRVKVLEEQNRFLAGYTQKASPRQAEESGTTSVPQGKIKELEEARSKAEQEAVFLKNQLTALQEEKKKWQEDLAQGQDLSKEMEALKAERDQWEKKAQELESQVSPLQKEKEDSDSQLKPLQESLGRFKRLFDQRHKDNLLSLEDLARGFAHRVRNYLGIMSGTLQLCLSNYKMEEDLQEQINLVDENAQEMLQAIEEFLSLARIPEMTIESVDLNKFLNATITALEDKLKDNNVRVQWALAETVPAIKGDTRLLGEAISAIVVNSVEAMPEGGSLEIGTAYDSDKKALNVSFKDTGSGIRDNHLRKVFQPYFSSKKGHKGLGLSVCKRVMDLMRAGLHLESTKDVGTTLVLSFPTQLSGEEPEQK